MMKNKFIFVQFINGVRTYVFTYSKKKYSTQMCSPMVLKISNQGQTIAILVYKFSAHFLKQKSPLCLNLKIKLIFIYEIRSADNMYDLINVLAHKKTDTLT